MPVVFILYLLILAAVVAYIALAPFLDIRHRRALARQWHREQERRAEK